MPAVKVLAIEEGLPFRFRPGGEQGGEKDKEWEEDSHGIGSNWRKEISGSSRMRRTRELAEVFAQELEGLRDGGEGVFLAFEFNPGAFFEFRWRLRPLIDE